MTTVITHSIDGTGHYKGYDGFKNDANAATPYYSGWSFNIGTDCTAQMIASAGTHNKVLELYDNNAAGVIVAKLLFGFKTSGTIEYWIMVSDSTVVTLMQMDRSDAVVGPNLRFNSDATIEYRNVAGAWTDIVGYAANTWYRMRIDFECGDGGYEGLAADTMHVYINDTKYSDLQFYQAKEQLTRFYVSTSSAGQYYVYLDAVGFAGILKYSIGDNATQYTTVPYKHAKTKRGTHESHHDFSAFDITKMSFPSQI